ncbi:GNAT family N-acetyltransferase [Halomonas sp. NyZ770]|uniref:GNAT family N-acetyltransferase n=1 Tax=Halomonas sp. NyZ770 TaxID=2883106 RepID=UPI00054AD5E8|nr:GNAT family N-acetyltransferase [Halomonas sp. NyZ770]KHJ52744.1 GCN5 family acetyltransferase [Halomonas hydrothermalis]NGO90437.1 GNAT family N-acetyltransferase [Halomonas sp.]UDM06901.1 GNAT family N-acetyltransferase [Halomonas sp. NyZ770]
MTQIRPAVFDDLAPLSELLDGYRQFYQQPSDLPAARRFLELRMGLGDSYILVSEASDGSLTGFVQLYPGVSTVGLNARWTLNDLFVQPASRTQGTGRALMEAAARLAQEHGVARLILMTQVENQRAQALYESLGWQRNTAFYGYLLDVK